MTIALGGFKGYIPSASAFIFEVDGMQIGTFGAVSGLELNVETVSYREGGANGFEHQFPGRITWPHLVLRRGMTNSDVLFDWVQETAGPGFEKNGNKLTSRTGALTAVDSVGSPLRTWSFSRVIAVRWKGPQFDSSSADSLEEELEIAHDGFTSKTALRN
jgi:hypothetical protein